MPISAASPASAGYPSILTAGQVDSIYAPRWKAPAAQGAVTISWDDGRSTVYDDLMPRLRDTYKTQRHTFCITPGLLGSSANYMTDEEMQDLADVLPHCEIANHSQTHTAIDDASAANRLIEYDTSQTNLETLLPDRDITSFVYPYGGLGASITTHRELWGRFDRIVGAGDASAITPLHERHGMFLTPRPAAWTTATHQKMLELVRIAAANPVIANIYSHIPGSDMSLAELDQLLTLCDTLGVPVINLSEAYPRGFIAGFQADSPAWSELWGAVTSGSGNTFDREAVTKDTNMPGTYSFHLESPNTANYVYATTYIPATEGKAYTFSARAKRTFSSGSGYARIRVQPTDYLGVSVGSPSQSSDIGTSWEQATVAVTMPALTKMARLDMIVYQVVGEAWFDHLHFGLTADGVFG